MPKNGRKDCYMLISQIIERLQIVKSHYGDIEVKLFHEMQELTSIYTRQTEDSAICYLESDYILRQKDEIK